MTKLAFERSGGVAGLRLTTTVDTAQVPPDEASKLESLLKAADLFTEPTAIASPRRRPDEFEYKLAIEEYGRQHIVTATDSSAPPALMQLFDELTRLAKHRRR